MGRNFVKTLNGNEPENIRGTVTLPNNSKMCGHTVLYVPLIKILSFSGYTVPYDPFIDIVVFLSCNT